MPRRERDDHLHQQRDLRHDRRTDGTDVADRPGHADLAVRARRRDAGHADPDLELLSTLDAPAYIERVAVNNVAHVRQAKKAILKAFRNQVEGKGFSLVEVVSTCPTNWGLTPDKACAFVEEKMIPFYPLGNFKDKE